MRNKFPATAEFIRNWGELYTSPQEAFRAARKLARHLSATELNLRSTWAKSPLEREKYRAALELHDSRSLLPLSLRPSIVH